MKLDFDYIRAVSDKLKEAYLEDGGSEAYIRGDWVYRIEFEPSEGAIQAHVAWPMFKQLVANCADAPAKYTMSKLEGSSLEWLYWTCRALGVELRACLNKNDLIQELMSTSGNTYTSNVLEDLHIETLFNMWQALTGWNLGWPSQKEVQPNG